MLYYYWVCPHLIWSTFILWKQSWLDSTLLLEWAKNQTATSGTKQPHKKWPLTTYPISLLESHHPCQENHFWFAERRLRWKDSKTKSLNHSAVPLKLIEECAVTGSNLQTQYKNKMPGWERGLHGHLLLKEMQWLGKKPPPPDMGIKKEDHIVCSSTLVLRWAFNSVRVIRWVSTTSQQASLGNFPDAPKGAWATFPQLWGIRNETPCLEDTILYCHCFPIYCSICKQHGSKGWEGVPFTLASQFLKQWLKQSQHCINIHHLDLWNYTRELLRGVSHPGTSVCLATI